MVAIVGPTPGELLWLKPLQGRPLIAHRLDGIREVLPTNMCIVISAMIHNKRGGGWRCWVMIDQRLYNVWAGNLFRRGETSHERATPVLRSNEACKKSRRRNRRQQSR